MIDAAPEMKEAIADYLAHNDTGQTEHAKLRAALRKAEGGDDV